MENKNSWSISFETLKIPVILLGIFYSIAIGFTISTGKTFYLFNFGYIGTAIALGAFLNNALPKKHILWGRRIAQILVASYMLIFLGFIKNENMQIEGLFFYLLMGIFGGATIHYMVAKIVGPIFFNRGWCGWACWTAMVIDLLPWKRPREGRLRYLGSVRYLHFFLSLGLILFIWYVLQEREIHTFKSTTELYWLAGGNLIYYVVAIALAGSLKDNRAFCKYVCPIPTLQKVGGRFAIWKMEIDPEKCNDCGTCEKLCPMGIKLLDYKSAGQRILSTECILCTTCLNVCPRSAIDLTTRFDIAKKEHLAYRDENRSSESGIKEERDEGSPT